MFSVLWTVGEALNHLFAHITEEMDAKVAAQQIRQRMEAFASGYQESVAPDFDYENPLTRFAYVYLYVGAHANLFVDALSNMPGLSWTVFENLSFERLPFSICAFGGGPGSELLGAVKYIYQQHQELLPSLRLDFLLIDKVVYWNETWEAVIRYLRQKQDIRIDKHFLPLDFTSSQDFTQLFSQFRTYWLFVFNYAISETLGQTEGIQKVMQQVVRTAGKETPGGPLFVFIDRNQFEVKEAIRSIIDTSGLVIEDERTVQAHLPPEEQKEFLGEWLDRFQWFPKIRWNSYMCWAHPRR